MKNDSEIASVINPVVEKYPGIIRVGVFGSYARNEPEVRDIDIVFDESPDNNVRDMLHFLTDLQQNIWDEMHKETDILAYRCIIAPTDDEDDKEIRQNILNDIIWIYDKNNN